MEQQKQKAQEFFNKLQTLIYATPCGNDELLYTKNFLGLIEQTKTLSVEQKIALAVQIKAVTIKMSPSFKTKQGSSMFATSNEILYDIYLKLIK